jgi:hypothetical protein
VVEMTTASLEWKRVQEITGRFFVPRYQRGYRWTSHEVIRLLEDVRENGDQPYSLQPVVVKAIEDGRWELVDGQQRLTTLYLILRYFETAKLKSDGPRYTIAYETRPGTEAYLRDPRPEQRDDNPDFHHIYNAYECIARWFEAFGPDRQLIADDIYRALLRYVRVIWYVAPADLESTDLFTRLNVGRIPLTDAELVKALLLTLVRNEGERRRRQLELALAWDRVEQDLWNPEVWAFVCGDSADVRPTRITLLLDALAGPYDGDERPPYHTFDQLQLRVCGTPEKALELWGKVLDLHGLLMGWFADRRVYHKVGYLVALGVSFESIVREAIDRPKSEFEDRLRTLIRERLDLAPSDVRELSYESAADRGAMHRLLLLMNVESVARRNSMFERYPFARHGERQWSLEHIHAQNSEALVRAEQWESWRVQHLEALEALPSAFKPELRDALVKRLKEAAGKLDRKTFPPLAADVTVFFTDKGMDSLAPEYGVHGIANMALLDRDDNAALNNAVFEVKRRRVLELDRQGKFLPVCTRQVFLKYYSYAEGQQLHLWGPGDREAYLAALMDAVTPYLVDERVAA